MSIPGECDEIVLNRTRLLQGLAAWYSVVWIALAIAPRDRHDWLLENLLAIAAAVALLGTYRLFQFSTLSYALITSFLTLHAIGAHYTYAEVPAGFLLQQTFGLSRNPFDRLVHFAYGLFLVYPLRELLIRLAGVVGFWAYYLPISGMLAQSGLFEIIEALVAQIVSPELGTAYLGMQGDEWDAQMDMIAAFSGAMLTMIVVFVAENGTRSVARRSQVHTHPSGR